MNFQFTSFAFVLVCYAVDLEMAITREYTACTTSSQMGDKERQRCHVGRVCSTFCNTDGCNKPFE